MKKLIVLAVLMLMVSLIYALMAPFFEVRALVANTHLAVTAMPQTQTPRPIRTLPGLEEIRVWLGPTIVHYSFDPNHIALTTRRATLDVTNFDMKPPAMEGQAQAYDVFYSDADGILNVDGPYLTIEAVSYSQAQGEGGGNVAELGLRFSGSTTFEYGNEVASQVVLGVNAEPTSIRNALDGNTETYTRLGNTAGQLQRLRITLGFLSSSGTPSPALPTVSIDDTQVREGNSGTVNAVFRVRLSAPAAVPVTVSYSTQDSTATAPDDYTVTSGTLTFPENSTLMTITVPVKGDTLYEGDEVFFVNLSGPINVLIGHGRAIGTITDDDMECSYSISPLSSFVEAFGGSGSATMTASPGCEWRATDNVGWLRSPGRGTGSGKVSYAVDANDGGVRAAPLYILGQVRPGHLGEGPFVPVGVHWVSQDGPSCPFLLICALVTNTSC